MKSGTAIVLTNGWLAHIEAKTCHGLLRGSDRFSVVAVVDKNHPGEDACKVSNVSNREAVPVYADIAEALEKLPERPDFCIVGVAVHGGYLPDEIRQDLLFAAKQGISPVNGLHSFLSNDPEFLALAEEKNLEIIDVRKPRTFEELRFWSGDIYSVKAPRIAVLGTDCAIGKRTTCSYLLDLCQQNDIQAEMIYTGQTGWMQGYKYGFIFDSTLNDFISGEIEREILKCDREASPEVILIEGQSSLRNPSGPCGSEFIISGHARGVILHHAPSRKYYDGAEYPPGLMPPVETEVALIRALGAETLAITLNESGMPEAEITSYQNELREKLGIPVVRPLKDGLSGLLPVIQSYIRENREAS